MWKSMQDAKVGSWVQKSFGGSRQQTTIRSSFSYFKISENNLNL